MSSKNSPSLTSLRAFSVAGNCLSVTGAAQHLGVTQSAVSRQIKALEDSLEFKLFDRIGNSINLTAEGQAFHQKVFTSLVFSRMQQIMQPIPSRGKRLICWRLLPWPPVG